MSARARDSAVLVVGLGRFGSAVADALVGSGVEVLAVDSDPRLVKEWADRLTQVVEGDTTDLDMLRQIGAAEISQAVVAIGTSVEASVLTVSHLSDLGVAVIWAKALSPAHGRILERVGASHVVYPEREIGEKTARLLAENLLDYLPFGADHALAAAPAPRHLWGLTLAEARTRTTDDVTIVAVRRPDGSVEGATAATVVDEGDTVVLLGTTRSISRLATR
jgi:trk system potassium uptake protein TrkA